MSVLCTKGTVKRKCTRRLIDNFAQVCDVTLVGSAELTHHPLLLDRMKRLAPLPIDWIDPAPAIARRVSDLLGSPGKNSALRSSSPPTGRIR